ncbi:MAG: UDP-N-acetylmuramate dehydrogenase [Rickettsiales bacterium]
MSKSTAMQKDDNYLLDRDEFKKFNIRKGVDLSKTNWFRVGGVAQYLFKPENARDLADFFSVLPKEIPVTVLGVGSNVIIRDSGIDGVVIKLGRDFNYCRLKDDEVSIEAGASTLDINVALVSADCAIEGLEFLSGIPGTIGGAVRMNAGAYGSDVSQVLVEAEVVKRDGTIRRVTNSDIGFVYRNSNLPKWCVITSAVFKGRAGDSEKVASRIEEISRKREETQPIRMSTGGSTFKNPMGHKAWELIEMAGCRGMVRGGAQVSEKHCNFLINNGGATAADLEGLGEEVIKRVFEKTGITLEWEIKRIGNR